VLLNIYEDFDCDAAVASESYPLHVARLGVNSIQFDNAVPLTYHMSKINYDAGAGISTEAERYAIPQDAGELAGLLWRLGDDQDSTLNVDDRTGEAKTQAVPYKQLNYPLTDPQTFCVISNSFNYPVCYIVNSHVTMTLKTSAAAWSQVDDKKITNLNYSPKDIDVHIVVTNLTNGGGFTVAGGGDSKVDQDMLITLRCNNSLEDDINKEEDVTFRYTWFYVYDSMTNQIPGYFETTHMIYRILDEPQKPWERAPVKRPWVKALDFAIKDCGTAGVKNAFDALVAITRHLHSGHGMSYDTIYGEPHYTENLAGILMNLTAYMKKVSIKPGLPNEIVNCYDQATAVYSFGTILGINVQYIYLDPFGYINTTDLVGPINNDCNNPFYTLNNSNKFVAPDSPDRTGFGNHAFIIYKNVDEYVFDACAGPVLGKPILQYINDTIDVSLPKLRIWTDPQTGLNYRIAGNYSDIVEETVTEFN